MITNNEKLKELNKWFREQTKVIMGDWDIPPQDEMIMIMTWNSIKQTELLQELIIELKGVSLELGNQMRSFNREFEGKLRRSR
jgi:hypothetical protein